MSRRSTFNPGSFTGAIHEHYFARGWGIAIQLEHVCKQTIRRLRKRKQSRSAQALADKLQACVTDSRCKAAACPKCAHATQKMFTGAVKAFLKQQPKTETIVCVSIVPEYGICPPKELSAANAQRNRRRSKDALSRAGVTWFIGGIDYSFNEHEGERYPAHWAEHIFGFTSTDDVGRLKRDLRAAFPASDAIPRPVKIKVWDGRSQAIRYSLKNDFVRRVATDDAKRMNPATGETRVCRATTDQRLRSRDRVRLAMHLNKVGLQGRVIMRGAQFVNRGKDGASIALRVPKKA